MHLLTEQAASPKLAKDMRFLSAILYMAPHKLSGVNLCPGASPGCIKTCLNTAGRGAFTSVQSARVRKAKLFWEQRGAFLELLRKDLNRLVKRSERLNKPLAVRLNGTTDVCWQSSGLLAEFPMVQFYDYTKVYRRLEMLRRRPIANYHLTFSRSESNDSHCLKALSLGFNVAVVFKHSLPASYLGHEVIAGDASDMRFLDPKGVIVGLTAKGLAKRDRSGFVVDRVQDRQSYLKPVSL